MSALVREGMFTAELWISFSSLVRSYTAVASLNLKLPVNVVADELNLTASAGAARLCFQFDPASGAGNWLLRGGREEMSGRFELLPEGRMALEGKLLDLDHAAIDFAAALMQAAANPAGTGL